MVVQIDPALSGLSFRRGLLDVADVHPLSQAAVDPTLFELIDLCVAYYALDRSVARPACGWSRHFTLRLPVLRVDIWRRNVALVREWLSALTGDVVDVVPIPRTQSGEHHERDPVLPLANTCDVIGLLSDGLDSLCGADAASKEPSRRITFASVVTNGNRGIRIAHMVKLANRCAGLPRLHTILKTKLYERHKTKDKTQRSRTVLALVAGMTSARCLGAKIVESYENGFGILNLPVPDLQYGAMSSQVLQPRHLPLWDRISRAFFDQTIQIQYPNRFRTKAEMVGNLSLDGAKLIAQSFSCDSEFRKKAVGILHCGTCGSCRLRQLALACSGMTSADVRYANVHMNNDPDALEVLRYHASLLRRALAEQNAWQALCRLQPELDGVANSDDARMSGVPHNELEIHERVLRERTIDLLRRHVAEVMSWKEISLVA